LARQLNLFVAETTGSTSFRDVIMLGAEERWIDEVFVTLVGSDDKIRQRVSLVIDWDTHSVALSRSDGGVIPDKRFDPKTGWLGGALSALATDIAEIAHQGRLTAEWSVTCTAAARKELEKVHAKLGLKTAEPREWADGQREMVWGPKRHADFHELTVKWQAVVAPSRTDDST
jgi:hypothetical protein